ncbi:membrane protein [Alkalihalobacillus alcalophilus ATCC 27647 = CGMCC 1.3604]|nr:membrane protein [Alkalihalobacillus alcalophilus ATCC 27647 = CGMCC 1.3604]
MVITGIICGVLLGFVMQRGRFCLTGGFRDMFIAKDNRMFYALLIAIAVHGVGIYILIDAGLVQFSAGEFSWLGVIIGSFIFGIGIILAGGCATGTWYRAGEGLIGSWIALATYMLMAAVMRTGPLAPLNGSVQEYALPNNSMAESTGLSVWVFVVILLAVVTWVLVREFRKPKVAIPSLKPKRTGLAHLLFEKRWHPFFTAVLIGVIAVAAWPLSQATGRMFGLGITAPSANILQYIVTSDTGFINWGVFLVLGIFLGSFIAAKGSREFRFRMPDVKTGLNSASGGLLMGFGASLAGGCSIGNGLVMTAMMTWQGWIGLSFMILGTWTASYFVFIRPMKKRTTTAAPPQAA